jgi:excinuclease ABC subunit C
MTKKDFQKIIKKLPESSGIYLFKKGKKILYIGKATSLRDRVRSYFSNDLIVSRGPRLVIMLEEANSISFKSTPSVLEAIILEANEIKKHQPTYNSLEKDDKSYNYVVITDEKFPRVLIQRGRELKFGLPAQIEKQFVAGPFPNGGQLKEALKIVRKIFPFRDKCAPFDNIYSSILQNTRIDRAKLKIKNQVPRPCFNYQIGLCPGVCIGEISARDYQKTINNIELFFSGQTSKVKKSLQTEMKFLAKERKFERAEKIKRTLFALDHIRDVSLIKNEQLTTNNLQLKSNFRIEAYDIAHISGSGTVGVMVVSENDELNKNEYRKFKIRGEGKVTVDDTKNLKELLTRRFGHSEWQLPGLIVIDGGIAQNNAAKEALKALNLNIEVVSVVKDSRHNAREIIGVKSTVDSHKKAILLLNLEAHRFSIAYHRKLMNKRIKNI